MMWKVVLVLCIPSYGRIGSHCKAAAGSQRGAGPYLSREIRWDIQSTLILPLSPRLERRHLYLPVHLRFLQRALTMERSVTSSAAFRKDLEYCVKCLQGSCADGTHGTMNTKLLTQMPVFGFFPSSKCSLAFDLFYIYI